MENSAFNEIEKQFTQLSFDEQLLLIERLVQRLRNDAAAEHQEWDNDLAAMAADPSIQRELRHMDAEFRCTEGDGLEERAGLAGKR
jgi:hypothetical protein